ncbi:MAG: hypothetical protein HQ567_07825 [Candidatus Nealsonbacteria bacterium]|nr:hypothetical protein [Candidatus Nealsonbacteria bacterium]
MNFLVAIEGISYAGKTTLCRSLAQHFAYHRLYELGDKFDGGIRFPPFPETDEEACESDHWFLEQEIRRYRCAKQLLEVNPVVVMDRSHLSSLAFTYARERVFKIGSFARHKQSIEEAVSRGLLPTPPTIVIDIDWETCSRRRSSWLACRELGACRGDEVAMSNRNFVEQLIHFYRQHAVHNVPECLMLRGTDSAEQLLSYTATWITKKLSSSNSR